MKFGSWTFNGDQVSLKFYNDNDWVDLSDYWKSGTWDIVEVPAFLNVYNNSKNGKVSFLLLKKLPDVIIYFVKSIYLYE